MKAHHTEALGSRDKKAFVVSSAAAAKRQIRKEAPRSEKWPQRSSATAAKHSSDAKMQSLCVYI